MAAAKFVSYLRVSTQKQGASGLGLEAQQVAVAAYVVGEAWELVAEFQEVETGKGADALAKRPQLRAALASRDLDEFKKVSPSLSELRGACLFPGRPAPAAFRRWDERPEGGPPRDD